MGHTFSRCGIFFFFFDFFSENLASKVGRGGEVVGRRYSSVRREKTPNIQKAIIR